MPRYPKIMIAFHWASAVLVLAAWLTSHGGPSVRANPPLLHFSLGFAVLALIIPRLIIRLMGGAPRVEDPQGPWLNLAAKIGHTVLYVFLIGLPLTGWYAASRLGVPISFFGLGLPTIAAPVQGAPGLLAEVHETGGTIILWLAGLHALIALWHQFVLRDGTLRRMSPV
ncbi:cytochrome b [Microvirga sp. Mcv34]|uniref:cytochrome b n=1 Tax=Microvirga sp. Mcv34 TaxID=2926016 RepID=UPI0021C69E8A|nr:cytochrome b [Microvirga sp. Mcv34]